MVRAGFKFEKLEYELAAAIERIRLLRGRGVGTRSQAGEPWRASKPHGTAAQRIGKRIPMNSPNSNGWTSLGEASATLATPACSSSDKQELRLLGAWVGGGLW